MNTPWAESAFQQVTNEIKADRLAHALLIQGAAGIGLGGVSESIAAYRLCMQPTDFRCGTCKSCQLLDSNTHPDLMTIDTTGKAEVVKVDQIREAVDFLSQTPQISAWKLVVISEAHRMNHNAANALLKVLEEPPGNSLLLLVTDRPQLLLPTVRSRCRNLSVASPSLSQTRAYCLQNGVDEGQLEALLPLLGRRPMEICGWVKENRLADWQALQQGLEKLVDGDIATAKLTDSLKDISLANVLEWMMKMAATQARKTPGKSASNWLAVYERLSMARQDVERGGNPNRQLLLDECVMRWRAAAT